MPIKILEEKTITIAEAKEILENLNRELNQFQKRTLEYATGFSKIKAKDVNEIVKKLKQFGIDLKEAVQIINCMPESVEEIRAFLPRHKVIDTSKLQEIIKLLKEYRK
jgi:DNA-directed RNA polymerase subunit F